MTSQLLKPGRGQWTARTTVMTVIVGAHVAAIALAMLVRAPRANVEKAEPILVSLLTEQHNEPPPPPPPTRPVDVVVPDIVVPPLITIVLPQESPPIAVVANPAPPPPTPPAPVTPPVSRGDTSEPIMATSVEYVRPPVVSYPAAAKQVRASGTVQIRAVVEADGHVREVRVDRSSGNASLDRAAGESVRGALFRPYMHNGVPRAAIVIVPVDFSLKTRGARHDKGPQDERCGKPQRRDRDDDCGPERGPPPHTVSQAISE